jgi:hypothetical protein
MQRGGGSVNRRVVIFFAAFLGAIVVPQLIVHGLNALYPEQTGLAEDDTVLASSATGFVNPAAVLGASVGREMVQDARPVYPQVLQDAQAAQIGLTGTGGIVLAARFADAGAAERARFAFFKMLGKVDAERNAAGIWHFPWPQSGHWAAAVNAGRTFMLWVAPDAESLDRLRGESQALRALTPEPRTGLGGLVDAARTWAPGPILAAIGVYTLFVAWLFLRLVGWATDVKPKPGVQPAGRAALRQRLLDIRSANSPINISAGTRDDRVVVDWKYADAKWIDHARAHGMRKTHRLILQLDEADRTVRGREFHAETNWSAGVDGASIRWKAAWEIVFYQYEHERVFGLQLGPDGRLIANLSYAYTFDLAEMKDPIIGAITAAGWRWRQVFFFAPPWLKWLHS